MCPLVEGAMGAGGGSPGHAGRGRAVRGRSCAELLWRVWECLVGTEENSGRGLTRAEMWLSDSRLHFANNGDVEKV